MGLRKSRSRWSTSTWSPSTQTSLASMIMLACRISFADRCRLSDTMDFVEIRYRRHYLSRVPMSQTFLRSSTSTSCSPHLWDAGTWDLHLTDYSVSSAALDVSCMNAYNLQSRL